ncbi:hypothetical protein ACD578_05220 [Microvirga sp. RSM25]|uniref:hypothetical protein n=1 Tax=Microvirga sp. RSM25 TaxID=3273802 RepID=UPI00384CC080
MTPVERALEALFKHRDFPIGDNAKGERDCYAISIPTLVRTIEAAIADERERCAQVAESGHERWNAQVPCPVVCDVTACEEIAAAIRGM